MKTVDIPGGTAVFREDRSELRGRDEQLIQSAIIAAGSAVSKLANLLEPEAGEDPEARDRRFENAVMQAGLSQKEASAVLELENATAVATLVSWTLDRPLPTIETLGDLPADLCRALRAASGGMTGLAPTDFDPDPDESSPTTPSSGSGGGLRAVKSKSAPTSYRVGGRIATGASSPA